MYEIKITKSLTWNASKSINALIAGSRGMGKSWFAMYLVLKLTNLIEPTQIFAIDYKKSDISRWNEILPDGRVATTKTEIFELLAEFVNLMKERGEFINRTAPFGATASSLKMPLFYLIYDEMGAFASTLDNKEKKKHDELLSQITLLGRQYNFGLLATMQQASVGNSGLNSSVKEQFGLVAHMGTATDTAYRQTFGDQIEIPDFNINRGEGFIWIQNVTSSRVVKAFVAKDLSNHDLWSDFQSAFANQNNEKYLTKIN